MDKFVIKCKKLALLETTGNLSMLYFYSFIMNNVTIIYYYYTGSCGEFSKYDASFIVGRCRPLTKKKY
jgi:hypothetical protein